MDFLFNFVDVQEEENFGNSKKDILKYLKIIGVDTRFVSYFENRVYINNLRFSKFSKSREKTFAKQYPEIEVVRSTLFKKICSKSSKVLSDIAPGTAILLSNEKSPLNDLMYIILEPYTRKYGLKLVYDGDFDLIADPLLLDDETNRIFSEIFRGEGIDFDFKDERKIYPLLHVSKKWVEDFLEVKIENEKEDKLASDFMEFLDTVSPQYMENVLRASEFIESQLEVEK